MLQVGSQFRQKWLHDDGCPEVRAIYKIVNTNFGIAKYRQYLFVSLTIANTFALVNTH
jgi:hypothetical protein